MLNFKMKSHYLKRPFDFVFSLISLFVSLPLWFLFGFLICLGDRGPIFYNQERVGLNGKTFKLIKFHTMNSGNKKSSRFANLLRKTALDELPQLINILKGEMSFVGPRPLVPEETNFRFTIKPGLTGIAQISIPKDASFQEKSEYNTWYIKNQNLWLDIKLISLSLLKSLRLNWDR